MGLFERLMGLEEPKIPVHQFQAMMAERSRGKVTDEQIIDAFNLSAAEQVEMGKTRDRTLAPVSPLMTSEVDDVLLLAEMLIPPYNTAAAVKTRLGV